MSKDLFSNHATQYAAFRPTYPKELYDFIFQQVKHFDIAWDAGTGNGQVARDLSTKFKKVFATDISSKQIENAYKAENILYSEAAETTPFENNSIDLICVAQAIHWFNRENFYKEVKRVAKKNSIIAIWGYGLLKINEDADLLIEDFYKNTVGPYWDKERRLIDEEYQTIEFPFEIIQSPPFSFSFQWSMEQLRGYLTTWSAVQKFMKEKNYNPVDELLVRLSQFVDPIISLHFPLFTRIGRIN